MGSAWRAAPALAGQRAERRDGAAGGGQRAQEAAPPAGGGPGQRQRQRQVRAPRRARGGGTEGRSGAAGARGGCSGRSAAGTRRGAVIYGLPAAAGHWEAEGAVLRSPICYGGKQTRQSARNCPRSRLGRPRSVLGSCGSGAQVRSGETLCGSGQRSAGSGRAAACGLRGNACFVVWERWMGIKGHADVSRWILSLRFKGFWRVFLLAVFFLVAFCFFSFRMISIAFCLVSWQMQLSVL